MNFKTSIKFLFLLSFISCTYNIKEFKIKIVEQNVNNEVLVIESENNLINKNIFNKEEVYINPFIYIDNGHNSKENNPILGYKIIYIGKKIDEYITFDSIRFILNNEENITLKITDNYFDFKNNGETCNPITENGNMYGTSFISFENYKKIINLEINEIQLVSNLNKKIFIEDIISKSFTSNLKSFYYQFIEKNVN